MEEAHVSGKTNAKFKLPPKLIVQKYRVHVEKLK